MPVDPLFTGTILAVIIATLIMAFVANLPFAVAPGMGIIAYFGVIVSGEGLSWQQALTAVLVSGILFVILSLSPLRQKVLKEVPEALQHAVAAGIGLMIAQIGLKSGGVIVVEDGAYALGSIVSGTGLLVIIGIFVTGALLALRFRFALLAGIVITTIIGFPLGVTGTDLLAQGVLSLPPSPGPVSFEFDFKALAGASFWGIVLAFLFMEVFDSLGTFLGLFTVMGKDGERFRPKMGKAFVADSLGVVAGACFGMSPNTAYAESGAGVAQGGRTGATALVVAALFALCLLLKNVFLTIPSAAVAAPLVMVGLLMTASLKNIDFEDITDSFPAFAIVAIIGFTLRLSDGLAVGWILYIVMKLLAGKGKLITPTVWAVGALFLVKEIVSGLSAGG
jgi:AGZA family xanthine/uracil permease-like MFS transporter